MGGHRFFDLRMNDGRLDDMRITVDLGDVGDNPQNAFLSRHCESFRYSRVRGVNAFHTQRGVSVVTVR